MSTPTIRPAVCTTVRTPDGDFTLLAGEDGLLASGWTNDVAALVTLVHPSLRPDPDLISPVAQASSDSRVSLAAEAVIAYYAGDLAAPRTITVLQHSGEFRMLAWQALRDVPPGERLTYTEYAARAGRPAAVRAAAAACAMNAVALFVPCHRILRSDGSLGGFQYGLDLKRSLLEREGAIDGTATLF